MNALNKNKKKYASISNEKRSLVISAHQSGKLLRQISIDYDINYHTARNIIKVYEKTQRVVKCEKGHRKKILNVEQIEELCNFVDEDCTVSTEAIIQEVLKRFGKKVSRSTINQYLRNFHYTLKRVTFIPERRNTPEVIEKRYDYMIKFMEIYSNRNKIFFVDETGIQVFSRRSYGRSIKGNRANKMIRQIRSKNYSICSAINCESLYLYQIQNKAYNTDDFEEFLLKLMVHFKTDNIEGAFLVMDNVNFHKADKIKKLVKDHNHHLLFLPPYLPFLNPIENLFNQWKHFSC